MFANKTIRLLLLAIGALTASVLLVACGGDSGIGSGSSNEDAETAQGGEATGDLTISNWPYYIDPGPDGTVAEFQQETGINTTHNEDVNGNDEFFGAMQPLLADGDSGGRDIMVVTDWMAERMWNLGYLQRLDHDELPVVFDNMVDSLRSPAFDPDREFTVPWQSGMTGLVVRTDLAPDITSINDLFDPQYRGKVTLLSELRDTVPLVMAADGIDPEEATPDQWLETIDKIKEQVDNGQVRRFTGNNYLQPLERGTIVATIGWSGDAVQAEGDNIEYVQPEQGCSLWSDNMVIPVGAPNTPAAYEFMNFVYEPQVQADITEYVNFVSPVKGVKEILTDRDPEVANNQLIFPDDEFVENCFSLPAIPGDEDQVREIESSFQNVITGA